MEEYLQRLRQYLTQGGLTAVDARDGMVAAYLVISRLNQLQGNPDVGLKQEEAGLYQHFSGFLGAIFWERGYNYDHPTVQQLGEVKMMLDGTAQIFAMPENLQMALNEICDFLLARAGNQPAVVSSAVMDLLESHAPVNTPVSSAMENYDFSAPKFLPEAQPPAEPEPVISESSAPAVEPVPTADAAPGAEPQPEIAAEPEPAAAAAVKPEKALGELEPDLVALFDEAMKEETASPAPETAVSPDALAKAEDTKAAESEPPAAEPEMPLEPTRFDLGSEQIGTGAPAEVEGAETPAATLEPAKKKRGRKKAVETDEVKPKAVRKKAKTAKSDPAPEPAGVSAENAAVSTPVEAPARLEPPVEEAPQAQEAFSEAAGFAPLTDFSPGETAAPAEPAGFTAAAWESDSAVLDSEVQATPSSISELVTFQGGENSSDEETAPHQAGSAGEPVSEPLEAVPAGEIVSAPVVAEPVEEVVSAPVFSGLNEEVVSAPVVPDAAPEVISEPMRSARDEAFGSVPETFPAPEPAAPVSRPAEAGYGPEPVRPAAAVRAYQHLEEEPGEEVPVKTAWGMPLTVGLILGLLFGGAAAWMTAGKFSEADAARDKAAFEKQVAAAKSEAEAVKADADKMRATLKEQEAAWHKTPDKPAYLKVGPGLLLYWPNEGMMRKYFVYRGKGPAGNMVKVTAEPLDINFLYLSRVDAGSWRYAVSALTREGVETDKGEPAVLALPLK